MMSKMSDGANPMNSMMFGTKSNAKIYVKSTSGIKFSDVAGEEEAKELLTEIFTIPANIRRSEHRCQKVHCL